MVDLKDYICTVPFCSMELHVSRNFICCPAWVSKELPDNVPLSELWNSKEAIAIRESVMDGSYRYCDKTLCPHLSGLLKYGKWIGGSIAHKDSLSYVESSDMEKYVKSQNGLMEEGPSIIQLSFDFSCNFRCPSCRKKPFMANEMERKTIRERITDVEKTFGKDLACIYMTGSGDPFVSVEFRDFLRNFDSKKFPKLRRIHLHTNASKWNPEMWDTMKSVHPYIKSCEISVDAGTKETYENITRLGGNWNNLINNLRFINTLPKIKYIKTSFVVQDRNYKEMHTFLKLMTEIFGKKVHVYFGKINNWRSFTDEEFKERQVWDPSHPEYNNFLDELHRVNSDNHVFHNMCDLIRPKKNLI